MTTTERPTDSSTKAKPLTEVYTVEKDGRTFQCQKLEYLGDVYEVCWDNRTTTELFDEIFEGRTLASGDAGHAELVAFLDRFATPRPDSTAE